jgi:hypothetical protein
VVSKPLRQIRRQQRLSIGLPNQTVGRSIYQNKTARGRYYREDVISDACLAVAHGANSQRDIENAGRRSLGSEWALEDGRVPVEGMDTLSWKWSQGAPDA